MQKGLEKRVRDVGWECPQILAAMEDVGVYFDRVSQIRMDRWTNGRVALVGDAAACVSLVAGEGTGLAMAEAYVLAGELHQSGNDHITAFARYEERMMPFLKRKQESAAKFASSFAPQTNLGITFRNYVTRLLGIRPIADYFVGPLSATTSRCRLTSDVRQESERRSQRHCDCDCSTMRSASSQS